MNTDKNERYFYRCSSVALILCSLAFYKVPNQALGPFHGIPAPVHHRRPFRGKHPLHQTCIFGTIPLISIG